MQGDSESPGHGHGHGHDHGYDLPRLSRNFDHASALAMEGSPGDHARTLQSRISPAKKTAVLTSLARLGLLLLALSVTPGCDGPESGGVLLEVLHRRRGRLLVCALLVERRPAALGFTAAAIPGSARFLLSDPG